MSETRAMTLTDFLLARIAEDEGRARRTDWLAMRYGVDSFGREAFEVRVLAECEAKRRIASMHERKGVWVDDDKDYPACRSCGTAREYPVDWPCPTLRALALPYADHPDYREEWKS